ncbi:helix-turn-helix transcriptional regulator [Streptomyces sp. NPDC005648]|uniref:helix-turn-helix domain-containing protein n=1 Tax=Streptomyces sp. NPDC005648 TaxID=3157044 RepID=UPI0033A5E6A9
MTLQFDHETAQRLRLASALTPTQLARRVDKSSNTIWLWETGQRKPPLEAIGKLARALDVPYARLIHETPDVPRPRRASRHCATRRPPRPGDRAPAPDPTHLEET